MLSNKYARLHSWIVYIQRNIATHCRQSFSLEYLIYFISFIANKILARRLLIFSRQVLIVWPQKD
jgi:hypothetical protein